MVIAILTVMVGVIALLGLPLAQFPQIVPPQINVSTTYTGADAVTIEQSVATPIEQQVSGVPGMLYMLSTNAIDGSAGLSVTFDISTDPDVDQANVQNRVSQALSSLPTDVSLWAQLLSAPQQRSQPRQKLTKPRKASSDSRLRRWLLRVEGELVYYNELTVR